MPERASDLWWLFTRQTVCVTKEENIIDAARLMYHRNFRHLPIVSESSKVIGIISAQDIVDSLYFALQAYSSPQQIRDSLSIPVQKVMTPGVVAVEPGDGMEQIIKKIVYHNIGALPVVNEQGVIQGIITLRDLIALIGMSSNPLKIAVSEVMNTKITTMTMDESFLRSVELMSQRRVRRLPILSRKEKLMGVFTNKDVLKYLIDTTEKNQEKEVQNSGQFDVPISTLMTKDVITINQDDDLRVAASRMMIFGVGGLVVEDSTDGKIALITERDLIQKFAVRRSVSVLVDAMRYETEQ